MRPFARSSLVLHLLSLRPVLARFLRSCRPLGCPALVLLLSASVAVAAPIRIRREQGSEHGFLLLRSQDGKVIAIGDLTNIAEGDRVRSRLVFHFRDGSIDDDMTVFRQTRVFQLISDHHIQKGPSYPQPSDVLIDFQSKQVTTRTLKDGKEVVTTDHVDLPPDVANGIIPSVIQNLPPDATETKVSYVAADPKPRVVTLSIKPTGKDHFEIGGIRHEALVYNIHIEIGGVAGVVAPLIGKQPSDTQIWVTAGEVHAFLKMQGALYVKGPIWSMEDTSAYWPGAR